MSENFDFQPQNEVSEGAEESFAPSQSFVPFSLTPEQEEKRTIKKLGNATGIALIFTFLVSLISGIIVGFILVLSGNKINIIEDPALSQVYQTVFSIFVFTVPFIICFKTAGQRISDLMSFKKVEKGLGLPLFFLGLAFCSFTNIGASYVDSIFKGLGIDYSVIDFDFPKGIFGFALSLIAISIVPALVEEFAFRGLVLGSLRKFGDAFALIASSICFGVMHGNFEQMPFAFMVGLFLGFTVIKTGSMRIAILVHFFNNASSVLMSYFPSSVPEEIINVIYIFYLFLTFVLGVLFLKKIPQDFFSIEKKETELSDKTKYKTFFLSGGIIVFVIINLLEAISFIFI